MVHSGAVRTVDGDLSVVRSQSVTMSVRVGEETSLEHSVLGWLNAWDGVGGCEGRLLDLSEVVLRVAVERHASELHQRVVCLRPDLGHVKDVPLIVCRICSRHDLCAHSPGWEIALGNVVEEVTGGIVGVLHSHLGGLLSCEILDTLLCLEVEFDVVDLACIVEELVGVAAVAVHVTVAIRGASV